MNSKKPKIVRITTVPLSLEKLLEGQLGYMSEYFEIVAVSSDPERLEKYGQAEGVRTWSLELTRKITPLKDIKAVIRLRRFLKNERPEIVHTHTPKAGIVGMMAAYLAGVPVRMHTVAGLPLVEAKGFKRKVLNFVERLTYKFATNVYPNSFGLLDIINEHGFTKPSKLKVLGSGSSNGIDLDYFLPDIIPNTEVPDLRRSLNIGETDFVFLFVGRVVKDKGIEELVTAFRSIQPSNKQLRLVLVGPFEPELDPIDADIEKEINENPAIISTGYQLDVRPYFQLADVLVFPSYREGFPNVVLQSAAMKVPAIVSDINGCNEIITPGENGLICAVKDSNDLQASMEHLIRDPELRSKLKANSRKSIEKYERKGFWELLKLEYERLLKLL